MTQLPIPVHVGSEPPEHWDDIEARQREYGDEAAEWLQKQRRPAIAKLDLDWSALSFEPRWVGFDTADCAVALQPSIFSGQGADEFDRFRAGAENRGEIALAISLIGSAEDEPSNVSSVFGPPVDSVSIGRTYTSVHGRRIGKGARVRTAADLGDADGQLALRLLSCNPAPTWRSLSLSGAVLESIFGRQQHAAEGTLVPILETELGEPVVAVWLSPNGTERRYIVPFETPWTLLLPWLLEQALPEFVPGAMRRARRPLASDEGLMTRREREARSALTTFEAECVARRSELERGLAEAQVAASTIREGVFYGTGKQLVDAVRLVFEFAGIAVVDLDEKLGGTKNADLLCTYGGRARLVEVKSASGRAPERAYQDLLRHLREWPSLPGSTHVDGGALVMNHELRTVPLERNLKPYTRPEFLAAQTEPVISALALFAAWRDEDAAAVRQLVFATSTGCAAQHAGEGDAPPAVTEPATSNGGWRRWFQRR